MQTELLHSGSTSKHSRPYHPQTCGKVERFHQTLKRLLAKQHPATTKKQLQRQLDTFATSYNHDRPHRALGRRTPATPSPPGESPSPRSPHRHPRLPRPPRQDRQARRGHPSLPRPPYTSASAPPSWAVGSSSWSPAATSASSPPTATQLADFTLNPQNDYQPIGPTDRLGVQDVSRHQSPMSSDITLAPSAGFEPPAFGLRSTPGLSAVLDRKFPRHF